MSKPKRKRRTKLRPLALFRPRLDRLLADDAFPGKGQATIEADLDALSSGIDPELVARTVLRAQGSAPEPARARLDELLPGWLSRHNYLAVVERLIEDGSLSAELRPQALAWLEAGGADTQALIERSQDLFLSAYYYDDEAMVGSLSQATLVVFWHTSAQKRRARGMTFLLDYNPPWDGSVKDIALTPQRRPRELVSKLLDRWAETGMVLKPIGAERAKAVILTALGCNRTAGVRLPHDLIVAREVFVRHILSLPDGPGTPPFTMEDFDWLAAHGRPPEEIMHYEQTVGRRVRMEDGKEVLVMGDLGLEDC